MSKSGDIGSRYAGRNENFVLVGRASFLRADLVGHASACPVEGERGSQLPGSCPATSRSMSHVDVTWNTIRWQLTLGHSDFTDPKGACDLDVARTLVSAGAGEPRSPDACPACARQVEALTSDFHIEALISSGARRRSGIADAYVGQDGILRSDGIRPVRFFVDCSKGRLPIGRKMPSCPT